MDWYVHEYGSRITNLITLLPKTAKDTRKRVWTRLVLFFFSVIMVIPQLFEVLVWFLNDLVWFLGDFRPPGSPSSTVSHLVHLHRFFLATVKSPWWSRILLPRSWKVNSVVNSHESWTGGSCLFPPLPCSLEPYHERETPNPSPWPLYTPTGDNLVTTHEWPQYVSLFHLYKSQCGSTKRKRGDGGEWWSGGVSDSGEMLVWGFGSLRSRSTSCL